MSEGMVQGSLVSATMVSPIVAQIEYPVLKKLGKQNIRKFLTERRSYVREIEERNAQGNGTVGRPVSLNFSVDPSILESLVELGQLGPAVKSVSEVTDAVLITWLEKHSDLKKDGLSASQVQAIVDRSLRINMSEKDTEQRIIMLFADYRGILRNHGLAWIVDENPKTAVNHIVDALKPSILKKRIKDDLTFGHIALRKDFLGFMRHVIRRAEHYSDYEEPTDPPHKLGKPNSVSGTNTGPTIPSSGSCRVSRTPAANAANTQPSQSTGKGRARSPPACLNPSCSLKHYLKECQNTSQERKDELYAELAERRKHNGEQRSTRRDTSAIQPFQNAAAAGRQAHQSGGAKSVRIAGPPPAGRVKVSFQSAVDCIALPDSGADDNVIPRSLVGKIEESGLFIPTRTLKNPVRVDLAFQGPGLTAEVHHQAQLTVELQLTAGPLRLRNCKWLIVEHDMDEVLIGRPLLQALGLDAAEHLSAVRDEYNNMDCSQIPSLTCAGKLTRLLLRDQEIEPTSLPAPQMSAQSTQLDSVTYGELDADPVEVPQLLDLPASVTSVSISAELESMVNTAQKNGMPSQHVPTLRHLVN